MGGVESKLHENKTCKMFIFIICFCGLKDEISYAQNAVSLISKASP